MYVAIASRSRSARRSHLTGILAEHALDFFRRSELASVGVLDRVLQVFELRHPPREVLFDRRSGHIRHRATGELSVAIELCFEFVRYPEGHRAGLHHW